MGTLPPLRPVGAGHPRPAPAGSAGGHQALSPRTAQLGLSLSDPASDLVSEGDTLLRCKVAGWPMPLFIGRVTQRSFAYDDENETLVVNAVDPWVQLAKTAIFSTSMGFSGGIYSYWRFSQDAVAIMRDLINAEASNGHGIVTGTLPIGPGGGGTRRRDDGPRWTSPGRIRTSRRRRLAARPLSHRVPGRCRWSSDYLKATNWGFNIPSAATIVGVKVETNVLCTHNSTDTGGNIITNDNNLRLIKGGVHAAERTQQRIRVAP